MNTFGLLIIVLALGNITLLLRVARMKKERSRNYRMIRRLKRAIDKLDSRNGKLWYEISRRQADKLNTSATGTAFTVTRQ